MFCRLELAIGPGLADNLGVLHEIVVTVNQPRDRGVAEGPQICRELDVLGAHTSSQLSRSMCDNEIASAPFHHMLHQALQPDIRGLRNPGACGIEVSAIDPRV